MNMPISLLQRHIKSSGKRYHKFRHKVVENVLVARTTDSVLSESHPCANGVELQVEIDT